MKGTWKIVNHLLNYNNNYNKANLPDSFEIGDNTVSNKREIANSFNDHFLNLSPSLAVKILPVKIPDDYLGDPNPSSLFIFPAT